MRIALISDIHGNLFALEAVLRELEHEEFDHLVCLGDVADGPQPCEALERVRRLGCPVIMGNWDAAFLRGMPEPHDEVSQKLADIGAFWADKLSLEHRAFLETFVPTLELPLEDGGHVLFFHGSPRSYDDVIFLDTPEEEFRRLLGPFAPAVMAGGHTHTQMIRRLDDTFFFNPGSVGVAVDQRQPRERMRVDPWAEYAILSHEDGRTGLEFRRVPFDVEALLDIAHASGMPHVETFTGRYQPV